MAKPTFDPGAKMRRIKTNLENPGKALKQIGALMVAESQQAFKRQKFGDDDWPPRAEVNAFGIIADFAAGKRNPPKRRLETRPALRDTGRLASSISFSVSGDSVTVGTNLDYAAVHQTGGPVESKTITQSVRDLLVDWLLKPSTPEKAVQRMIRYTNKKWIGKKITGEVPARPFLGLTERTELDIREAIGVHIFEVNG